MTHAYNPEDPASDRRHVPANMHQMIEHAVRSAIEDARVVDPEAHEAHHKYLTVLLEREAKRSKLWDAVIEKSLAALVWALIAGFGVAALDYLRNHLGK
jgi:hypothetical protein